MKKNSVVKIIRHKFFIYLRFTSITCYKSALFFILEVLFVVQSYILGENAKYRLLYIDTITKD